MLALQNIEPIKGITMKETKRKIEPKSDNSIVLRVAGFTIEGKGTRTFCRAALNIITENPDRFRAITPVPVGDLTRTNAFRYLLNTAPVHAGDKPMSPSDYISKDGFYLVVRSDPKNVIEDIRKLFEKAFPEKMRDYS